jgi:uncharacterized protein
VTLETLAKENLNYYAPRFEIIIGKDKLAVNVSKEILEVTVSEEIDTGASFTFTLNDDFNMNTQKFKWLDDYRFTVGNTISIDMGYGNKLLSMIRGNITSIEPSFFANETPTLTIGGHDLSYDFMKKASLAKQFNERKYSDIAKKIAQDAGLNAVVDETENFKEFEPSIFKNNNETYCKFLYRIKEKIGFFFEVKGQTLYFVKPGDADKEILTMELGKDIISFRPTMKTTELVAKVIVRGHNPEDPEKPFVGEAPAENESKKDPGMVTGDELLTIKKFKTLPTLVITDVKVTSDEHAKAIAKAALIRANDTLFKGDVESIGLPQIRTGVNIRLDKLGARFSDKYYVTATTHTINNSGYRTRFSVKRNLIKETAI